MRMDSERGSGILLHITSLPGKYGIGDLGKEAYAFVDYLKSAKQKPDLRSGFQIIKIILSKL